MKRDPLKLAAAKAAKAAGAAKPTGVQGPAAAIPTQPDAGFEVTVPVRFHEIIKTNGNGGGDLSEARIAAQIDALEPRLRRRRLHRSTLAEERGEPCKPQSCRT